VQPRLEHPLAAAMRKVDLFPLLTGDPTSKAADIVGGIFGAANSRSMTSDQDVNQVILLRMTAARCHQFVPLRNSPVYWNEFARRQLSRGRSDRLMRVTTASQERFSSRGYLRSKQ
jgi:hypothetical protein